MDLRFLLPVLMFTMKYFFDVEKEITQQLLMTAHIRLNDCKELFTNLFHFIAMQK